jgi:hypothetical protein
MQYYTIYGLLQIGHAFSHIKIRILLPPTTLYTSKVALNHVNNSVQNFEKNLKKHFNRQLFGTQEKIKGKAHSLSCGRKHVINTRAKTCTRCA